MDGETKLPGLRTFGADMARARIQGSKPRTQEPSVAAPPLDAPSPVILPQEPKRQPVATVITPQERTHPEAVIPSVPQAAEPLLQETEAPLPAPRTEDATEPMIMQRETEASPEKEATDIAEPMPLPEEEDAPAPQPIRHPLSRQTLTLAETDEAALPAFKMSTGNIIRETKRERFKLLPSMVMATKSWAQDISEEYNAKRHPRHEVTQAEVRKHTIEAAGKEAEIAPKDDFNIVVARLKNVPRQKTHTGISFSKKEEMPAPQWTHLTETEREEESVTAQPQSDPVSEPAEAAPAAEPETPQYVSAVASEPLLQETEAPLPAPRTEDATEPMIMQRETEASPEKEATDIAEPMPLPEEEDAPAETAAPLAAPEAPQYRPPVAAAPEPAAEPRTFPLAFFGGVVAVALLLGVGVSFALFAHRSPTPEIVTQNASSEPPHLFDAQEVKGLPLPSTHEELLLALAEEMAGGGVSMLYFTAPEGTIAPAADVLALLSAHTAGSFSRNVTDLAFGSNNGVPFLILKTKDFDTAFAGILDWERTLSGDLSPLFGEPVVSSFDPTARTSTQLRDAFFTDKIVANKNARMLLDERGDDRIVYAFVDRNTLLITTTAQAFTAIVPLLR